LIAKGFDGIILAVPNDPQELVFFESTQLKSAIGNQGTFDSASPDIRFDEPTEAFEAMSAATVSNLAKLKQVHKTAALKPAAREALFKVTPLQIMSDVYSNVLPKLKDFVKLIGKRDARVNSFVDEGAVAMEEINGLLAKHFGRKQFGLGKGYKRGVEKFQSAVLNATWHKMHPELGVMEQDWITEWEQEQVDIRVEALTGSGMSKEAATSQAEKEVERIPAANKLKAAQGGWEADGMQEATGRTFREAHNLVDKSWRALQHEDLQFAVLKAADKMQEIRQVEFDSTKRLIEEYTDKGSRQREQFASSLSAQFNSIKGMYWPLNRDGKYELSYQDTQGVLHKEKAESPFEQEAKIAALVRAGIPRDSIVKSISEEFEGSIDAAPTELFTQLLDAAVATELKALPPDADEASRAAARERATDAVNGMTEVWLRWQPETSALKNSLQRQNIAGASRDAERGFLKYMQNHGKRISELDEGRQISALLTDMRNTISTKRKEGNDVDLEGQILNDLKARIAADRTNTTGQVAKLLGRTSTLYMMTSPSIALVQMSQLGILTFPALAVKYGPAAATKHLTNGISMAFSSKYSRQAIFADPQVNKAYETIHRTVTAEDQREGLALGKKIGESFFDKDTVEGATEIKKALKDLTKDQARTLALREGLSRNVMDISLSHEVGEIVSGQDPTKPTNQAFKGAMWFMRMSETASRKATIMATFDAAGGKDNFFEAMDAAEDITKSTLFDYSTSAKGVALRGDTAKVIMTFQTFRIMAAFRIGLMVKNSVANESKEVQNNARKELVGVMGMSALLAGTMGMPFVNVLMGALSMAMGDDDEPYDAETDFRAWLEENFGEAGGRVLAGGVGTLIGMTAGQRIGLGDVYGSSYGPWPTTHGRDYAAYLATQLIGPAYSVAEGWAVGYDEMVNKGNIVKGLEASTPKPVRDMIRAYGIFSDGVKLPDQRRILKAEDVSLDEVLLMGIGFQPTEIFEMKRKERNIAMMSSLVSERRGLLVRRYVREVRDGGDPQGVIEEITRFARKNPSASQGLGSAIASAMRNAAKDDAGVRTKREELNRQAFGQ